jgi:broad specificity phosphatase PhoE
MTVTPDTCSLLLLRHGATDNNLMKPPRLQGQRIDMALSATGVIQAEQTARFLAGWPVAAVFSSPLLRARQTAEAIARRHGLEVQVIDALTECDVGAWENRTWPEIEREDPDACRAFTGDPYRCAYRDGENLQQVCDRAFPALTELAHRHLGQQIVVVAHNVVNRVYLGTLLGLPGDRHRHVPQDNCGMSLVHHLDSQAKVITLNSIFHLSPVTH